MNLSEAEIGKECVIRDVSTNDEEMKTFLFSLGCYSGETITVVSRKRKNCVVSIKDGRYNMDNDLAKAIELNKTKEVSL
ncbi:MAG: FeoA family protein [Eubacterium sp.]